VYPSGYVHLPKIDAEFVQQLCAEQLVTRRDRNGFPKREWQKIRERNEALDCYVYARAAASASGLDRFEERHWVELERPLLGTLTEPPAPSAPPRADLPPRGREGVGGPPRQSRQVIRSRWL
jgi:phage terminase large subunit GpA-like protein